MSIVTNLILVFSITEEVDDVIESLKNFKYNKHDPFIIKSVDDASLPSKWYGGTKMLECAICVGSYNSLDIDGLIAFLKEMKWEFSESVQLIVKEQQSFRFRIVDIFPEDDED